MTMKQSPIFLKHYDLMAWLLPCTLAFPKSQRGVLARQVQAELFRIHEWLVEAGTTEDPLPALAKADRGLIRLRTYLRLCRDLKLLSVNQYEHGSRLAAEVGKLLGGWIRSRQSRGATDTAATMA
jgi:hypothetical protein